MPEILKSLAALADQKPKEWASTGVVGAAMIFELHLQLLAMFDFQVAAIQVTEHMNQSPSKEGNTISVFPQGNTESHEHMSRVIYAGAHALTRVLSEYCLACGFLTRFHLDR